jgi:DNA-binding PadR family transcriptional regulator
VGISLGSVRKPFVPARRDWTLLSIAASDRRLLPVQLQKVLYLVGRRFSTLTKNGFYEFRSISSGHFSEEIYADVDALSKEGLVTIEHSVHDGLRHYRATTAGVERARKLQKQLPSEVVEYLRNVVTWASGRSVDQLVRESFGPREMTRSEPRKVDPLRPR